MPRSSSAPGLPPFPARLIPALALAAAAACAGAPGGAGAPGDEPAELRVMTFNVRYGSATDGADSWVYRSALLMRTIQAFDPAILGVQEALRFQLDEIGDALRRRGEVGAGRDDGVEAGEYSAILYDRSRLTVLDHGTFWLSDTPGAPGSMSWGNRYPRVVTWARFVDAATGDSLTVLNTHWDHESQNARERSAALVVDWIARNAPGQPVVLMGDFNAGPANPAFRALLETGDARVRLRDSFPVLRPGDPVGTFHAFTGDRSGEKIDAVLVSPHWDVLEASIVTTSAAGRYPSDHFPVTATLLRGFGEP
ncbi:MAG TPA: endonuclease/exonuclease/phosphatase family protein [Longimicrobiales bacterium]|nr:endonuclease/exonuclease/phosphatase family protein [Longimicrobiales bacterium]